MQLTIFYDSHCPLCLAEMQHLVKHDEDNRIRLVDLHTCDLKRLYPQIDKHKAMQCLHGQLDNGEMLYGLDVTCTAWSLVGKYRWLKILRWPLIRYITDLGYQFFARYRENIALLVTGKKHCKQCTIQRNST
jgi:predicted DCC family thiol-disulfide oxidoreductase YuxK